MYINVIEISDCYVDGNKVTVFINQENKNLLFKATSLKSRKRTNKKNHKMKIHYGRHKQKNP